MDAKMLQYQALMATNLHNSLKLQVLKSTQMICFLPKRLRFDLPFSVCVGDFCIHEVSTLLLPTLILCQQSSRYKVITLTC